MVVGMTQMRKRRVVIRQLSALEALGGITNICSDKTGTLTQGRMITRKAWVPGVGTYIVNDAEDASDPTSGTISLGPEFKTSSSSQEKEEKQQKLDQERSTLGLTFDIPAEKTLKDEERIKRISKDRESHQDLSKSEVPPKLSAFLKSTALCNLASVRHDNKNGWQVIGDPTEVALQVFAHRFGYGRQNLTSKGWDQVAEYPFDSSIKRMSVIYQNEQSTTIFTKGAVETIIELCSSLGTGDQRQRMNDKLRAEVIDIMTTLASQGLRVMAIASKEMPATKSESDSKHPPPREAVEKDLTLLGLAGLYDPPRLESKDAVQSCTEAGIKVHMLTGDHPSTASAIAKEVGILPRNMRALSTDVASSLVKTAAEFDGMSESEIDALPTLPLVVARCAPDTKTRMIAALHRRKGFAAMTGDGVNDAPSLKAADVGIAMGMAGSDVAKTAADIVLTDDNFASIVNAISEGRRMFDNIQKFVLHLLVSNVAEVILLIVGLAFQDHDGFSVFPLSPLQILWINMLTSSFPAFGLGREKAASDIMRRPPHDNKRGVFTNQVIVDMLVYGTIMGACTLLTFVIIVFGAGNGDLGVDCNRTHSSSCDVVFRARATVFAELTWLILVSAWEFKHLRRSLLSLDPATSADSRFPFFQDIYTNKFLFYAVVIGAMSVFPAVYIPGLNTDVFKHQGITWEWGLASGAVVIFVLGVEAWKGVKRYFGWFSAGDQVSSDRLRLDQGFFSFARSLTRGKSSDSQLGDMVKEDVEKQKMVEQV